MDDDYNSILVSIQKKYSIDITQVKYTVIQKIDTTKIADEIEARLAHADKIRNLEKQLVAYQDMKEKLENVKAETYDAELKFYEDQINKRMEQRLKEVDKKKISIKDLKPEKVPKILSILILGFTALAFVFNPTLANLITPLAPALGVNLHGPITQPGAIVFIILSLIYIAGLIAFAVLPPILITKYYLKKKDQKELKELEASKSRTAQEIKMLKHDRFYRVLLFISIIWLFVSTIIIGLGALFTVLILSILGGVIGTYVSRDYMGFTYYITNIVPRQGYYKTFGFYVDKEKRKMREEVYGKAGEEEAELTSALEEKYSDLLTALKKINAAIDQIKSIEREENVNETIRRMSNR
jgi:hypothetical protein